MFLQNFKKNNRLVELNGNCSEEFLMKSKLLFV